MSQVARLAKPQLRGLLRGQLKRDFIGAVIFATVTTASFYFLIKRPRRQNYENFYKSYDPQADFMRMREANVFQSVKPGGEVGEGW